MPEDLLLELETAAPIAESLEKIEELLLVHVRDVVRVVEGMKGSALAFENTWRQIIQNVAKGETAAMQALRPRLLHDFEKRLNRLKLYHALAALLREQGKTDLPDADVLSPEIAGMERLKDRLFDRWHTVEDLERLAVEHYPLSQARLRQIASSHPPPPEWYQGEEERLFQD